MSILYSVTPNQTYSGDSGVTDYYQGTAASFNGDTIVNFKIGDQLKITDLTTTNLNLQINGTTLSFGSGTSITIDNLGPGRYIARDIQGGGVDVRLQEPAHNNFAGDGMSDILWRSDDGTVRDWLGQHTTGAFVGNVGNLNTTVPSNWHVVGTGDFNGDGAVDVLWRSDDGTVHDWLGQSNGSFIGNTANLNISVPNNWHIVGIGDFNGDGRSDILWRADDGTVHEWLGQANGGFVGNTANVNIVVPNNWTVVGTGDFNGDGRTDVLWRSSDGTVHDWLGQANGGFIGNTANVNITVPTNWSVVGTGDFNGDASDDILWRSTDGTIHEWLGQTDGTFAGNTANVNFNPGTDWHIVGIGDYNGDSYDDLLMQNTNGTITDWLGQPNGSFVSNTAHTNITVPANWHVQDPFVHDPLGV